MKTLDRMVVSMLNSPKKWSSGKYNKLWHYESKADMVTYIKEQLPHLAAKTSWLNMGVFYTSWKFLSLTAPNKVISTLLFRRPDFDCGYRCRMGATR